MKNLIYFVLSAIILSNLIVGAVSVEAGYKVDSDVDADVNSNSNIKVKSKENSKGKSTLIISGVECKY